MKVLVPSQVAHYLSESLLAVPRKKTPYNQQLSLVDREVLQVLKEPEKEVDENELFFKSLLPAMKSLNLVQTLELRSEIQHLVLSSVRQAQSGTSATLAVPNARSATYPPCTSATNLIYQQSQNDSFYRQEHYTTALEASHSRSNSNTPTSSCTSATNAMHQYSQNDSFYSTEQY